MTGTATFDVTERYRFILTREWSAGRYACFIGMNPSTATAEKNDPTVRRCIGYAQDWGYSGLLMLNLFAYRTPSIPDLFAARRRGQDIIGGIENSFEALDGYIEQFKCGITIAAWGVHAEDRGFAALRGLRSDLHALALNKNGSPKHPLYLKQSLQPFAVR